MWIFLMLICVTVSTFKLRFKNFEPTEEWRTASLFAMKVLDVYVNATYDINVDMYVDAMSNTGVLATGYPEFNCVKPDNDRFFVPAALYAKMTNGKRCPLTSNDAHIRIVINTNTHHTFYFKIDGNTPSGMKDFVTVLLHETMHGLGFGMTGFTTPSGEYAFYSTSRMFWFDYFVFKDYFLPLVPQYPLLDAGLLRRGPLFFRGENPPTSIQLYTPETFSSGVSIAHTQDGGLMWHIMSSGSSIHCLLELDLDFLENFGYDVIREQSQLCKTHISSANRLVSFFFL